MYLSRIKDYLLCVYSVRTSYLDDYECVSVVLIFGFAVHRETNREHKDAVGVYSFVARRLLVEPLPLLFNLLCVLFTDLFFDVAVLKLERDG